MYISQTNVWLTSIQAPLLSRMATHQQGKINFRKNNIQKTKFYEYLQWSPVGLHALVLIVPVIASIAL